MYQTKEFFNITLDKEIRTMLYQVLLQSDESIVFESADCLIRDAWFNYSVLKTAYKKVDVCTAHNESCDNDGYCNACGEQ